LTSANSWGMLASCSSAACFSRAEASRLLARESFRVLRDWFMGICCPALLAASGWLGSGFPAAAAAAEAANSSASAYTFQFCIPGDACEGGGPTH
jgi:hypothetical protein